MTPEDSQRLETCLLEAAEILHRNTQTEELTSFESLEQAVRKKMLETETLGDSFANFNADLTQEEIKAFFEADNPRSPAIQHLGTATTRIIYDLERVPVCAAASDRTRNPCQRFRWRTNQSSTEFCLFRWLSTGSSKQGTSGTGTS
jgi:hypothetical protein